jgi:hypothetical protein
VELPTVEEQEAAMRSFDRRLVIAVAAYRQVWDSWRGLDAHNADQCRRAAMSAALAAADAVNI